MKGSGELLTTLTGVGPKLAEKLRKLGLAQVDDLLFHLPLRYEDRTRIHPIGSLQENSRCLIEGEVEQSAIVYRPRRQLIVVIADGSGQITLRFFHFYQSQQKQLKRGTRLRCFGAARQAYGGGVEMIHPEYRKVTASTKLEKSLTPIYPTTDGVGQATLRKLVLQATEQIQVDELLESNWLNALELPPIGDALSFLHQPPPEVDIELLQSGQHPALRRLAIEELLVHRLSLRLLRRQIRQSKSPRLNKGKRQVKAFIASLPFKLTDAQQRVAAEVAADLGRATPTMRLIQGDVGSGKTVVAAIAALQAIANGKQAALAAPTEILAEQHFNTLVEWFEPLDIKVVWLTSKIKGKQRETTLAAIADDAQLIIGTHALMQESVAYRELGLVIVDEQHRFGVDQRLALSEKGQAPHQITMTATPIPRTLAMTAYADLDVSVIDELPPGRKPIKTVALANSRRSEVIQRVAKACADGHQAYWVCTIIEESDAVRAQAATDIAEDLKQQLPELDIALVHGRLKPSEKDQIMSGFKAGQVQLLVATTVIEVGVDVPNASLMIIDNAERLGLSQLHQLRGRVGRGSEQSACVLLYQQPLGEIAKKRLETLRKTNDGFAIAQMDLELRGPGEVLGTRQTGLAEFRIADLARDAELLPQVSEIADDLLDNDEALARDICQRWLGKLAEYGRV